MTETMIIIIVAGVVIIAFGVLCLISMFRAQKETQNFVKKMVAVEKDLGDITKLVSRSVANSQRADENILLQLQRQADRQIEIEAERKAEKMLAEQKAAEEAKAKAEIEAKAKETTPKETIPRETEEIEIPVVDVEAENDFDIDEIDINDLLDDLEDVLPEIDERATIRTETKPKVKPKVELESIPQPVAKTAPPPNVELQFGDVGIDALLEGLESPKVETTVPQIQHVDYDIGKSGKKYTASELEALIRE